MENLKKFNINDYMYIQINDSGWAHLLKTVGQEYINVCIKTREVEISGEKWYRLQCHVCFDLMPILYSKPMFNTNVMFDAKSLE